MEDNPSDVGSRDRIEDWKGPCWAARRLDEAHKLLEEVSNMLGDVRRDAGQRQPGAVTPWGESRRVLTSAPLRRGGHASTSTCPLAATN